jgi:hypothetical protein
MKDLDFAPPKFHVWERFEKGFGALRVVDANLIFTSGMPL